MNELELEKYFEAVNQSGFDSNMNGHYRTKNPFYSGTPEHKAWEAGWLQGEAVRLEWQNL